MTEVHIYGRVPKSRRVKINTLKIGRLFRFPEFDTRDADEVCICTGETDSQCSDIGWIELSSGRERCTRFDTLVVPLPKDVCIIINT